MSQRRSARNKRNAEILDNKPVEVENEVEPEVPLKKRAKTKKQKPAQERETTNVEPELSEENWKNASSIYEFTAKDINGKEVSLKKYKGHVCIIVNVASRCGHTTAHYKQLNELHTLYAKEKGLKILAFPCNQFGGQEPGDNNKICEYVKKKNVEFDVFEKIDVNGTKAHPLWNFLKNKIDGAKGPNIDWNFTKFIIDKDGEVVGRFKASIRPLQLVKDLEKYW